MSTAPKHILDQIGLYREQLHGLEPVSQMTYTRAFEDDLVPIQRRLTTPYNQELALLAGCIAFAKVGVHKRLVAVPFLGTTQKDGEVGQTQHTDTHSLVRYFASSHGIPFMSSNYGSFGIETYAWKGEPSMVATYAKTWNNYPHAKQRQELCALVRLSANIPEMELCIPTSPTKWLRIKAARSSRLRLPS